MLVFKDPGDTITGLAPAGPETLVQEREEMLPSESVAVAATVVELVGKVMALSAPALTTGTALLLTDTALQELQLLPSSDSETVPANDALLSAHTLT